MVLISGVKFMFTLYLAFYLAFRLSFGETFTLSRLIVRISTINVSIIILIHLIKLYLGGVFAYFRERKQTIVITIEKGQ